MSAGAPGDFEYQGQELALFAGARRWRAYWQSRIGPYLGEEVLEVGAGIGTITADLAPATASWTALEPDTRLVAAMPTVSTRGGEVVSVAGTVSDLDIGAAFDTVLYIDVLEHIEADAEELAAAADLLRPGGHLIVLVPAFPFLYSPFDASVGHHRRYTRSSLRSVAPPSLLEVRVEHLDTLGFLSAAINRLLLRQEVPIISQIRLWDGLLVPMSRLIDPVLGHRMGKSLVAVWRRTSTAVGTVGTGR